MAAVVVLAAAVATGEGAGATNATLMRRVTGSVMTRAVTP